MIVGAALAAVGIGGAPGAHGAIVPPQNPPANIPASSGFDALCLFQPVTAACTQAALTELDADRAREGVGPLTLPTNFSTLTMQEQIFVVADLERVDRGLAPMTGLAAALDTLAQTGAVAGTDPSFPPYGSTGGSNWASGQNFWWADQGWMYDDGLDGPNIDCTTPSSSGCWGHRTNILANYQAPALMGAGQTTSGSFGGSVTELFLGGDSVDTPYFTWAQVTPNLPVGLSQQSVNVQGQPGTTRTVSIQAWASGEAMDVGAQVSAGPFSVTPTQCDLAPGQSCTLSVAFAPQSVGTFSATLTVTGPNGPQNVSLSGSSTPNYRVVGSDGGIYAFNAPFEGSVPGAGVHVNNIVGMASDTATGGYWVVGADGGIYAFDAPFEGSVPGAGVHVHDIVGMASDAATGGYWVVGADGGIYAFNAPFEGSVPGAGVHVHDIVGIASDAATGGYWVVGADGGIYAFNAPFEGSVPGAGVHVHDIVGMASDAATGGYWVVGADGGIYAFDAPFEGSVPGAGVHVHDIVGMASYGATGGYWVVGSDGGIYAFDAPFEGSVPGAGVHVHNIVGMASG